MTDPTEPSAKRPPKPRPRKADTSSTPPPSTPPVYDQAAMEQELREYQSSAAYVDADAEDQPDLLAKKEARLAKKLAEAQAAAAAAIPVYDQAAMEAELQAYRESPAFVQADPDDQPDLLAKKEARLQKKLAEAQAAATPVYDEAAMQAELEEYVTSAAYTQAEPDDQPDLLEKKRARLQKKLTPQATGAVPDHSATADDPGAASSSTDSNDDQPVDDGATDAASSIGRPDHGAYSSASVDDRPTTQFQTAPAVRSSRANGGAHVKGTPTPPKPKSDSAAAQVSEDRRAIVSSAAKKIRVAFGLGVVALILLVVLVPVSKLLVGLGGLVMIGGILYLVRDGILKRRNEELNALNQNNT